MSHYEDEAQVEQLRRWWRENWIALVAGLGLGLGGIYGWEYYQHVRTTKAETASRVFEDLKRVTPDRKDRADELWRTLSSEHAGTPYAAQGALLMAAHAAAREDWADAQAKLEWVRDRADDPGLKSIAALRLARVQWQQGQPDAALKLLEIADDSPFAPLYQELRGDILLVKGEREAARAAYEKALKLGPAAAGRDGLQRKLDDLGGAAPAPAQS
jgi:predicted negative regulator of RcsB-dependent stress response